MACVISSISMKGGVGKTTSLLCLSTGLADRGKKVLMLDLDVQGSFSIAMGCDYPDSCPVTMAEIFQMIDKGQSYKRLKPCYIIFICPFDMFGRGRHIYF